MKTRIEKDSMGPLEVPADAYYGVQTQRAVTNFPISGWPLPPRLIHAMGRIKRAAAKTNLELGLIEKKISDAIVQAATEVVEGKLDAQFPVDIFQTGSGTSTNMNTTRRQVAGSSQRSRQPLPIEQRRFSDGDSHQRHRSDSREIVARVGASAPDAGEESR